jgi:hypothetical protein
MRYESSPSDLQRTSCPSDRVYPQQKVEILIKKIMEILESKPNLCMAHRDLFRTASISCLNNFTTYSRAVNIHEFLSIIHSSINPSIDT